MSDDETRLRVLLAHAVSDLPAIAPPTLTRLGHRRRRAAVTMVVSVVSVVLIVVAAAVVALVVRHGSGTNDASPSTGALPGYTGPKVTAAQLAGYRWRTLPAAPIASRSDSVAVWTGTELVVWGGDRGNTQFADGASYNPATRAWTRLPPAPLSARAGSVATWVDGYVVIWGAFSNPARQLTDGARYDPNTRTWTRLPAVSAAPGYTSAQLVTVGSSAVLLRSSPGTGTAPASTIVRADAYDPRTNTWQRLLDLTAPPTHHVAQVDALGVGDTVFVWTSWSHTIQTTANSTETNYGIDAARLDLAGKHSWTSVPASPDEGAAATNPQWTGNRIFLPQVQGFCGFCAGPGLSLTPAVLIDPRTGHRTTIPSLPTGAATAVWTGAAVLDVGNTRSTAQTTAAFDPATGQWHTLTPGPASQGDSVSVWTGHELIQWGNGYRPAAATGDVFAPR